MDPSSSLSHTEEISYETNTSSTKLISTLVGISHSSLCRSIHVHSLKPITPPIEDISTPNDNSHSFPFPCRFIRNFYPPTYFLTIISIISLLIQKVYIIYINILIILVFYQFIVILIVKCLLILNLGHINKL